jgi:AraC family transcriptional regulator
MYKGIQKIEEVIDYIESNITEEINCELLAEKMQLSLYEFRRIFSFIVGVPLSEYIRKRRLSLAALEISRSGEVDMITLSEKYGYSSQSAFIKAFGEQHGKSPKTYSVEPSELALFTRPKFDFKTVGGDTVKFKIVTDDDYFINGIFGISDMSDSECCESVWQDFYNSGIEERLESEKIYASYKADKSSVSCFIGKRDFSEDGSFSASLKIPSSPFAVFSLNSVDDATVNEFYEKILYEFLPSANLKRNLDIPIVEVFPSDMSKDGFAWEIRIPIENK